MNVAGGSVDRFGTNERSCPLLCQTALFLFPSLAGVTHQTPLMRRPAAAGVPWKFALRRPSRQHP